MKTLKCYLLKKLVPGCFITLFLIAFPILTTSAAMHTDINSDTETHYEYNGIVVDRKSGTPLEYANFLVVGTNISIVSNKEGEFLLKVPKEITNAKIKVSFMGYKDMIIPTSTLKSKYSRINMESTSVKLPEVEVVSIDPYQMIRSVIDKKAENYLDEKTQMKAFYRETIKNKRDYVSLAEAVVNVVKQPYSANNSDYVKLNQTRKKTIYTEMDSLYLRLVGGPINCLKLDLLKNQELIFTEDMMSRFKFSFDSETYLDNKLIYIINFKQIPEGSEPLYSGKMYIDAENMALKSAVFSLNFSDLNKPTNLFLKDKPSHIKVYPIEANYRIEYFEKEGKWYYGYSRIELGFQVDMKKVGYKDKFYSTMEMAVFNWDKYKKENAFKFRERFLPTAAIANRVTGFADPDFWGENNIIEPEKSIQSAIEKIRLELEKEGMNRFEPDIQASK